MKNLVIYHNHCHDGLGAAWCMRQSGEDNMTFHPALYHEAPPQVDGDTNVYIVDFSYKPDAMKEICDAANRVVLLDHHSTALDALLPIADQLRNFDASWCTTEMSGAAIAFNYVNHTFGLAADLPFEMPPLIKHIQDRDLWKFELEGTYSIHATLSSLDLDVDSFNHIMQEVSCEQLASDGEVLLRVQKKHVESAIRHVRETTFMEYRTALVNAGGQFASDIGGRLSGDYEVVMIYEDLRDVRKYCLRSRGDIDVSKIAAMFGGGGHKNAAGFSVPLNHWLCKG